VVAVRTVKELRELDDVSSVAPQPGETLAWDGAQFVFTNLATQLELDAAIATVPVLAPGTDTRNVLEGPSGRFVLSARRTGDAVPRFAVDADGRMEWGGGAGARDVFLYRSAADQLNIEDRLHTIRSSAAGITYSSIVSGDAFSRFVMTADGAMSFGAGNIDRDVTLYRSGADILRTDDSLQVGANLFLVGGGSALIARSATSTSTLVLVARQSADAADRVAVRADGRIDWGDGTAAVDTNLYRASAEVLKTDRYFEALGALRTGGTGWPGTLSFKRASDGATTFEMAYVGTTAELRSRESSGGGFFTWYTNVSSVVAERMRLSGAGRLELATQGNTGGLLIGGDVALYRSAADRLETLDQVQSLRTAAGDPAFSASVLGDAIGRFLVFADGRSEWGDGTNSRDVALYRGAANQLYLEDRLHVIRGAIGDVSYSTIVTGDTTSRWSMLADGKMRWGPGNATDDTVLYRESTDVLRTDDQFNAARIYLFATAGDGFLGLREQSSDPVAPAANDARVFCKDNGAGKTQLCVRFNTGAVVVIATEP
jgi:hypothetical protein